jgi:hypothetical protein
MEMDWESPYRSFSLDLECLADRVFRLPTDEETDAAPSAPATPPPAANEDNKDNNKVAVVGPKIQASVNIAKTIIRMH